MIDPRRVWSLLDIMNSFDAFSLCGDMRLIEAYHSTFRFLSDSGYGARKPDADTVKSISERFTSLLKKAEDNGFSDLKYAASMAKLRMDQDEPDTSTIAAELDHVFAALLMDLRNHKFLKVGRDRFQYVDHPELFGQKVNQAFPSAAQDIKDAGNCMASECNTAAVFHLMRATEWALRALAVHLGVKKLRSVNKSGKVKYTPVAYSDWEHILDTLQGAVDAKVQKLKRGPEKQKAQEFYYPALQDVRALRDAWRNHVMHTRAVYDRNDVNAVFGHVKRLMVTLAARVTEC